MPIVFGSDLNVRDNSFSNFINGLTSQYRSFTDDFARNGLMAAFTDLAKQNLPRQENTYVDTGFTNIPGLSYAGSTNNFTQDIKTRLITSQEPQLTVFVKKRAFSTLKANNDIRFMDSGEKLVLKATKILFENKCNQISAYEAVTKMNRLIDDESELDIARISLLADVISTFTDSQNKMFQSIAKSTTDPELLSANYQNYTEFQKISQKYSNLQKVLNDLSALVKKTKQAITTTWCIDPTNDLSSFNVGRGSGVIELTLVSSVTTSASISQDNTIKFNMQDPLRLSVITNDEIETAIAVANQNDVQKAHEDKNNISLSAQYYLQKSRDKDQQLAQIRASRLGNLYSLAGNTGVLTFSIDLSGAASNNVIGSIDLSNQIFNRNNYRLILSTLDPIYRLTYEEDQLVQEIFDALGQYVNEIQRQTDANVKAQDTDDVRYARKNMRLFYLGKHIVQPMDQVSIFIRSKTVDDAEQIGPLNSLLNNKSYVKSFIQNYSITDIELQNEIDELNLAQYGIDVTTYRLLRTDSFLRNAGMNVFTGLITQVDEHYDTNSGYVVNVSGSGNLHWLSLSRVNTDPTLDQTSSFLEDPLTAFKLAPDPATGLILGKPPLLQANVDRLNKSKLVITQGANKGKIASGEEDLFQDIIPTSRNNVSVFDHMPGLVYKWKQGIVTVALDLNTGVNLNGTGVDSDRLQRIIPQTVADPFAGLDLADIVSLLVTGAPHSFEKFVLSTQNIGSYTFGSDSNSPISYFNALTDILRSNNRALGNFQAYKPTNIDQTQLASRLSLQVHITQDSENLSVLQSKLASKQDQINANLVFGLDAGSKVIQNLVAEKKAITDEITTILNATQSSISQAQSMGYRVYGSQILGQLNNQTSPSTLQSAKQSNLEQKQKDTFTTQRTQLDVKYNKDKNLFILDDLYDKDLDIQAFALNLKNEQKIWASSLQFPIDICRDAANVINFEFFANTNGHIELRAPKYNKTPLTLLLRMMQLSQTQNINNYPAFLTSLFKSQIESTESSVQQINLQIKEKCVLLGIDPSTIIPSTNGQSSITLTSNLFVQKLVSTPQDPYDDYVNTNSTNSLANDAQALFKIQNSLASYNIGNGQADSIGGQPDTPTEDQQKALTEKINEYRSYKNNNTNTKRLTLFNDLNTLVSQYQDAQNTLTRLKSLSPPISNGTGQGPAKFSTILSPTQIKTLLEPFSDLIEDDITDTLGPGSSKRFIITEDKIIDYDFTESEANIFTSINVIGQPDLLGSGAFDQNGVPIIWAGATDFDLWKQYGWRQGASLNVPFFTSADLQCAPYAQMMLSRQRSDTVRGTITVIGNEYYQLGDVVYVATKDLLYYVTDITHIIEYTGKFTTTLTLRYGHPIGEYIPNPLDVIGKNLIKNFQRINNIMTNRQTANEAIGVSIGVVVFGDPNVNNNSSVEDLAKQMILGSSGAHNIGQLKNALIIASSQAKSGKDFPKIEIRGYTLSANNTTLINNRISAVKKWLLNPYESLDQNGQPISVNSDSLPKLSDDKITGLTTAVDMTKTTLSANDILNGRFPKEETRSLSPTGTPDWAIEIVLVYQYS